MWLMWVFTVLLEMNSFCWMYSALRPFARYLNTSASRLDSWKRSMRASQRSRNGAAFFGGSMMRFSGSPKTTSSSWSFSSAVLSYTTNAVMMMTARTHVMSERGTGLIDVW